MSKNKKTDQRSLDPTIIAAVIGVAGTIIVTLISVYGNRAPAPQPTSVPLTASFFTDTVSPSPVPTDTVPAGEATSTPAPATDTPEPTLTFTPVAPVPIGEDWADGCISSLWIPYPSDTLVVDDGNGCLFQPVTGFFAENGKLSFIYEARLSSAEVHGMFAPLPSSNGAVSIYVNLKDLKIGDIWIGVFADSSINSPGLLMTIPAGNVSLRSFAEWTMPGLEKITSTQPLNQGSGYGLRFEFTPGSVKAVVLPNVTATNSNPRFFFSEMAVHRIPRQERH